MTSRISIVIVAALLLSVLGACQSGRSIAPRDNPFQTRTESAEVTIYVTNLAFADATLYAVATGGRRRLGIVTGKREETFTFPMPYPTEMYVEIDLLAGGKCFTERVQVNPGDAFDLVIQIEGSSLSCGDRSLTAH